MEYPLADESTIIHIRSNSNPVGDQFENDLRPFDNPAYDDPNKSLDEDLNIKSRSPSRLSTASSHKCQRSESPPRHTRSWLLSNSRLSYHEVYHSENYYLNSTGSRLLRRDTHRREQRQRTPPPRRSAYESLDTQQSAYNRLDGHHRQQQHQHQRRNDHRSDQRSERYRHEPKPTNKMVSSTPAPRPPPTTTPETLDTIDNTKYNQFLDKTATRCTS